MARAGRSPIWSGPEGSSHNEYTLGRCSTSHFYRPLPIVLVDARATLRYGFKNGIIKASMSDTPRYQVFARKYRPETFSDLVGQDAMVQTLQNAFEAERIAHAFIMTGIRGTGKTSTARIIAKGMNCIGPDGTGKPTTQPCGACEHCKAIIEGRHVDVMEIDAASRTGVDDMRGIIDTVAYRAATARYKIYIIDEVHMLSTNAFNALLKTLEEPPEHVKFIFATTEIRKVPVTVLSRCQRFDLRRIEPDAMRGMLRKIADNEGVQITDEALALITRASEGSARDATSLLDQAVCNGADQTTATHIRAILGLADRARVLDLFEHIMRGDVAAALDELTAQYNEGADPLVILRELAEITHWVSIVKITPEAVQDPSVSPEARTRGAKMAQELSMRVLTRMWQMLLTALEEISRAPSTMMAAQMAIIRMTHMADLPTPDDLIRKLQDAPIPDVPPTISAHKADAPPPPAPKAQMSRAANGGKTSVPQSALPSAQGDQDTLQAYLQFEDVLQLIQQQRDVHLFVDVEKYVKLVRYRPGLIELEPAEGAPSNLAQRLSARLQNWTGQRWTISVAASGGAPTIEQTRKATLSALEQTALAHPTVKAVFEHFPGAKIIDIKSKQDIQKEAMSHALPELEEEWDPFEE